MSERARKNITLAKKDIQAKAMQDKLRKEISKRVKDIKLATMIYNFYFINVINGSNPEYAKISLINNTNNIINAFVNDGLTEKEASHFIKHNFNAVLIPSEDINEMFNVLGSIFEKNGKTKTDALKYLTNITSGSICVNSKYHMYNNINLVLSVFNKKGLDSKESYKYLFNNLFILFCNSDILIDNMALLNNHNLDLDFLLSLKNYRDIYSPASLYNSIKILEKNKEDVTLDSIKSAEKSNNSLEYILKDRLRILIRLNYKAKLSYVEEYKITNSKLIR